MYRRILTGSGGNVKTNISSRGDRYVRTTYDEIDEMAMILQSKITKAILNQPFSKVDLDLGGVEFEIPLEVEPAPREYFQNVIGKRPSKPLLDRNAIRILENYDTMESTVTCTAEY